jgi:hypothetical protein
MILAASRECNAAGSDVKLTLLEGRPVVEGVFLNGKGPFRFLLDTGGQTNLLEPELARGLGLSPSFLVRLATVAGETAVPGGKVMEVSLENATARDQEFLFGGLEGVRELSREIKGVLGQEFLSKFDFLIDLRGKTLFFGFPTPSGSKVPVDFVEGMMTVPTNHGRLVLDSGSNATIIYGPADARPGAEIQTSSGSIEAMRIQNLRIEIGGRRYLAGEAARVSRRASISDGLLPLNLFRAVYVSNSGGFIVIDPETRP